MFTMGDVGMGEKPDFQALRRNLNKHSQHLQCYAFDLLKLNGKDLRERPLVEHKAALENCWPRASSHPLRRALRYRSAAGHRGRLPSRLGRHRVEEAASPYKGGRQESWLKSKCRLTDNFPIIAFVEKLGAHPRRIASFYVGRRENGKLLYGGKIQSGFTLGARNPRGS